jgi:hypothetical protein
MPLIKPRTHRVRIVRHICRLQEPNRDVLVHYARFIGDTADYVLNQLIDTTIAKDREFSRGALSTGPRSRLPKSRPHRVAHGRLREAR